MDNYFMQFLGFVAAVCVSRYKFHYWKFLILLFVVPGAAILLDARHFGLAVVNFSAVALTVTLAYAVIKSFAPLIGIWEKFDNYYVAHGKVVDSSTYVSEKISVTSSAGTFGTVKHQVHRSTTNHDTVYVLKEDGKKDMLHGIDLSLQLRNGDEVAYGGTKGADFYYLKNYTKGTEIRNKVTGPIKAFFLSFALIIPAFSQLIATLVCAAYIKSGPSQGSAIFGAKSIPTERNHAISLFLYAVVIPLLVALGYYANFLNQMQVLEFGIILPYALLVILIFVYRKDHSRFESLLKQKIEEQSNSKLS